MPLTILILEGPVLFKRFWSQFVNTAFFALEDGKDVYSLQFCMKTKRPYTAITKMDFNQIYSVFCDAFF